MKTIHCLLRSATKLLPKSTTASFDMEHLLGHVLGKNTAWIYAHGEHTLAEHQQRQLHTLLQKRNQDIPIAYLTGTAHFWSLELLVNQNVLVPRPESELLVECVLAEHNQEKQSLLDIGTGSGALALALASERPNWSIIGVDIALAAIAIAKRNQQQNQLHNVAFYQSDSFATLPALDAFGELVGSFDIIISNPPYLAVDDAHLHNLRHEPQTALVAGTTGLEAYQAIITQAKKHLRSKGAIYFEHGNTQAQPVGSLLAKQGFVDVRTHTDLQGWQRVTQASA